MLRRSRRAARAAVALLAGALLASGLGACGDDGDRITVYTGRDEVLVKPLFAQFTTDTGIKVKVVAGDSTALAAQILAEGADTEADVFFSQYAGARGTLAKAGVLEPLPEPVLGRVASVHRGADGTWVGASGRARVIVYDPAQVPTPPTGITNLLDPRWRGKVGYAPTSASWLAFVTGLRVARGEDGARAWLTSFARLQPRALGDDAAVRDAVDRGELAMGLVNHYSLHQKIAAEGAPNVRARNHVLPDDIGGLLNVAGAAVVVASRDKPAAVAFVEYLVSDAGQRFVAEKTFEYPLVASIKPAADLPAIASLRPLAIDLADLDEVGRTQDLLVATGLLTR
jgi:iron(III) transport system substrate-binding protein